VELLQALPTGGSTVAVIVVVIIFIKKQEHYEARMDAIAARIESIAAQFLAESAVARREYLDRLDRYRSRETQTPPPRPQEPPR
jgi:hypothetical protein